MPNTINGVAENTRRAAKRIGGLTGLITGLDTLTDRNLKSDEPQDSETMAQLGLDDNAIIRLRKWVNIRYRDSKGKDPLTSQDLKLSTKFKALKKLCGLEDAQ